MMLTLKTQISKFDGTVTELEKNLGLHDDIHAYLQLERDGNWYAYRSGVAKAAIFKYATYNHTSRRLKFDELRPNSRLLRSQSIYLDFDCERSRSRTGSGQRQTDSFPNSECYLGGGSFLDEGDILPQ